MKKKIIAVIMAAVTVAMCASVFADDTIKVFVNGDQISFAELNPYIDNEHTLVPMREIFEALGADVEWDDETRTIISYDPVSDVSVTMQIDSDVMFVNETPIELETPPTIPANTSTAVVPVRAVAEGMNSVVGWDEATRTVTVIKEIAQ